MHCLEYGEIYTLNLLKLMNFLMFSELNVSTIYLICEEQIVMALPSCENT